MAAMGVPKDGYTHAVNLRAAGDLYKKLVQAAEGYACAVPGPGDPPGGRGEPAPLATTSQGAEGWSTEASSPSPRVYCEMRLDAEVETIFWSESGTSQLTSVKRRVQRYWRAMLYFRMRD